MFESLSMRIAHSYCKGVYLKMRFYLLPLLFSLLSVLITAQHRNHRRQSNGTQCDALRIQRPHQRVCISYRLINNTFGIVKSRRSLLTTETEVPTEVLGLAIVETTTILTRGANLNRDDIETLLPLINMGPTGIRKFCPARMLHPRCTAERYRSIDGSCNNLRNAHYGATDSPTARLLPPLYADGVSLPRLSVTGAALPNVRQISTQVHKDTGKPDHPIGASLFLPAFGQLIGHDFNNVALTGSAGCCQNAPVNRTNPSCGLIRYPATDPFFSRFRQTCANFPTASSGLRAGCRLGSKVTFNSATTFLDASFVYGSSDGRARRLRSLQNGLLHTDPTPRREGLKELLPPQNEDFGEDPNALCTRTDESQFCTFTGDFRSSQTPMMIVGHTLFMRENNRIARELFKINPHWNDEQIYQETRRIIAAFVQHITYGEFLPIILGPRLMRQFRLSLLTQGMATQVYNGNVDPSLPVAFNAAAFRFGHSLIPARLERWNVDHSSVLGSEQLRELFGRPFNDEGGILDQYIAGFLNQMPHSVDEAITEELTNHLFEAIENGFGQDLASTNLARGRDEGLPGYNAFRRLCGLTPARNWDDLANTFANANTLEAYKQLYASVDDIDLWSGGISERHPPDSIVGPVFGCIIGTTFQRLRRGDRFWYENGGFPNSFTLGQLNEIRKMTLSRIICDNSENIQTIQRNAFLLANSTSNHRVPCASLPQINLDLWRENQDSNDIDTSPVFYRRNRILHSTSLMRMFADF